MRKKRTKTQEQVNWTPDKGSVMENIVTDPFGMYTGVPAEPDDRPVQDSDDL